MIAFITDFGKAHKQATLLDLYTQVQQSHALVWMYALLPFPDWVEPTEVMLQNLRDRT